MLDLKYICKLFSDVRVLNGVRLYLESGLMYTLKGTNGSKKTNLINIISCFLPAATKGVVEFKGKRIAKFVPYRVNRLGIGRTFQDLRLATQMTVYENILLVLKTKLFTCSRKEQEERADEILTTVYLMEKRNELAGKISYEQRKLLSIWRYIANHTDLLLIYKSSQVFEFVRTNNSLQLAGNTQNFKKII